MVNNMGEINSFESYFNGESLGFPIWVSLCFTLIGGKRLADISRRAHNGDPHFGKVKIWADPCILPQPCLVYQVLRLFLGFWGLVWRSRTLSQDQQDLVQYCPCEINIWLSPWRLDLHFVLVKTVPGNDIGTMWAPPVMFVGLWTPLTIVISIIKYNKP